MILSPLDAAPPLRARPEAWRAWLAGLTPGARADLAADAEDALAGTSDALRARYRALLVRVPAPVVHAAIVLAVEAWEVRRRATVLRRWRDCGPDVWDCVNRPDPPDAAGEGKGT